jgi:hypothetical protein
MNNPIYAVSGRPGVKESYGFISTEKSLQPFLDKGWEVSKTVFGKARKPETMGYQKHMLTLVHPDFPVNEVLGARPQLVLLNGHDAGTAFRAWVGLLRGACMNGLIAGDSFSSLRVIHSQRFIKDLDVAIGDIAASIPDFVHFAERLKATTLTEAGIKEFIKQAYELRLSKVKGVKSIDMRANPVRSADTSQDAFTVFNRVQERVIRGGITYIHERDVKTPDGLVIGTELAKNTTRKLSSVQQNVTLNRELVNLIERIAA